MSIFFVGLFASLEHPYKHRCSTTYALCSSWNVCGYCQQNKNKSLEIHFDWISLNIPLECQLTLEEEKNTCKTSSACQWSVWKAYQVKCGQKNPQINSCISIWLCLHSNYSQWQSIEMWWIAFFYTESITTNNVGCVR